VKGGVARPAGGQLVAEAEHRRREGGDGHRHRLGGERRDAARELGGYILRRERQPREATLANRLGKVDDERNQPLLELDGRGELGPGRRYGRPALSGRFEQVCAASHVGHSCCYNVVMINVSETAASKITELLTEENKDGSGLRVFVQGGGCSGFQYGLMIEENGQGAGDQVFESHGVKLFVDPISIRYLNGAEVDFVDTITGGGFTIKNPNATSTCGCGSSFSVE
jgi:iron-sulfur cluster assembly accessory protein